MCNADFRKFSSREQGEDDFVLPRPTAAGIPKTVAAQLGHILEEISVPACVGVTESEAWVVEHTSDRFGGAFRLQGEQQAGTARLPLLGPGLQENAQQDAKYAF